MNTLEAISESKRDMKELLLKRGKAIYIPAGGDKEVELSLSTIINEGAFPDIGRFAGEIWKNHKNGNLSMKALWVKALVEEIDTAVDEYTEVAAEAENGYQEGK